MRSASPSNGYRKDTGFEVALEREVLEEVGAGPKSEIGRWVLSEDIRGGFIHVGPVALRLEPAGALRPQGDEGGILYLDSNSIEKWIVRPEEWTPGSYLRLLIWLGAGMPGAGLRLRVKWRRLFREGLAAARNFEWQNQQVFNLDRLPRQPGAINSGD